MLVSEMYALINDDLTIREIIKFSPEGMYHPSLRWVPIPVELWSIIDQTYWFDGEYFYESECHGINVGNNEQTAVNPCCDGLPNGTT